MEEKAIADFLMGDEITGFYYITRADLKSRRDKQGNYLAVDLSDATGQIPGHVWENADAVAKEISAGDVAKVQGNVHSYQGKKQMTISRMRKASESDDVEMSRLVASVGRKVDTLWREYVNFANSVVNPFLRSLLRKFIEDEDFRINVCKSPGSKDFHHQYLGGLLEHTINVTKLCEKTSTVYTDIDVDLLLTAALLHDVGKIKSFQQGPTFEFTEEGRMLGPKIITIQMIVKKMQEIAAFPEDLAMKLQHIILRTVENNRKSNPAAPMMSEAIILYSADRLDCMQNILLRAKKREHKGEVNWEQYLKIIEQNY
jgi:3'-5' exoribonuclease